MVEAALGARDVAVGPHDERTSLDLPDEGPSPEQLAAARELQERTRSAVSVALSALTDRERRIVETRSLEEDGPTLALLGRELGLSRERVRQIEQRAHQKLRSALAARVA
jgi:RNA polymerase sigma-32 factor